MIMLVLLTSTCQIEKNHVEEGYINTVQRKMPIDSIHFSLTHEHVMSNFGADQAYVANYDRILLFNQVVPYLKFIKSQGVHTLFDCTTAYFGRDVKILKMLSDSIGINIVTNTGFYGAANDSYVPQLAYELSEEQLAEIWISEFESGIDQTGIKPGFVKLAFDEGSPSAIDLKLFKAGIMTHLRTGLTLAVHTDNNPEAALAQLQLLKDYKVHPSAWIWVHAHQVENQQVLYEAALQGAWISLDGVNESNINNFIYKIEGFKKQKLLHKILLSHDGDLFPFESEMRKCEAIMVRLIPALLNAGYTNAEVNQLMIQNPREAFRIKVRRAEG
jgi:predicted metal-dependent phosphotriesterase family hydrolase